jgi:hypothetical protein
VSVSPPISAKKFSKDVETLVANRSPFRITPNRQFAMKILMVATFALLCAARTKASADCRDEVAAAFERLRTSGRPYRKETTWVISDQQTSREKSEFVPPDRMRGATSNGVPGYAPTETILVGQRAWLNASGGWPWAVQTATANTGSVRSTGCHRSTSPYQLGYARLTRNVTLIIFEWTLLCLPILRIPTHLPDWS